MSNSKLRYFLMCSHEFMPLKLNEEDIKKKLEDDVFRNHLFRHYIDDDCIKVFLTVKDEVHSPVKIDFVDFASAPFRWSPQSVQSLILNLRLQQMIAPTINEEVLWNNVVSCLTGEGYPVSAAMCKSKMNSLRLERLRIDHNLQTSNNCQIYELLKGTWSEEEVKNLGCPECAPKANVKLDEDRNENDQPKDGEVKSPNSYEVRLAVLHQELSKVIKAVTYKMARDIEITNEINDLTEHHRSNSN